MPRVKSFKSLAEICINSVLENQELFCEKFTTRQPEDGVDALDSDKAVVNPFDELRKLQKLKVNQKIQIF
jgi:hypothetical protein